MVREERKRSFNVNPINPGGKTDGQRESGRMLSMWTPSSIQRVLVRMRGERFSRLCHGSPSRLSSVSVGIVFQLVLIWRAPAKLLLLLKRYCLICCLCLKIYQYRATSLRTAENTWNTSPPCQCVDLLLADEYLKGLQVSKRNQSTTFKHLFTIL